MSETSCSSHSPSTPFIQPLIPLKLFVTFGAPFTKPSKHTIAHHSPFTPRRKRGCPNPWNAQPGSSDDVKEMGMKESSALTPAELLRMKLGRTFNGSERKSVEHVLLFPPSRFCMVLTCQPLEHRNLLTLGENEPEVSPTGHSFDPIHDATSMSCEPRKPLPGRDESPTRRAESSARR